MGQSTSPPSGNLVDGLPLDCSTRAVVYEIKMGAAKNGKLPPKTSCVAHVCSVTSSKSHRMRCGTYGKDSHGAFQMRKT